MKWTLQLVVQLSGFTSRSITDWVVFLFLQLFVLDGVVSLILYHPSIIYTGSLIQLDDPYVHFAQAVLFWPVRMSCLGSLLRIMIDIVIQCLFNGFPHFMLWSDVQIQDEQHSFELSLKSFACSIVNTLRYTRLGISIVGVLVVKDRMTFGFMTLGHETIKAHPLFPISNSLAIWLADFVPLK